MFLNYSRLMVLFSILVISIILTVQQKNCIAALLKLMYVQAVQY